MAETVDLKETAKTDLLITQQQLASIRSDSNLRKRDFAEASELERQGFEQLLERNFAVPAGPLKRLNGPTLPFIKCTRVPACWRGNNHGCTAPRFKNGF